MNNGLSHVAPVFHVTDLNRSIRYYQGLGFDIAFEYDGFYAGLVQDGCHVHLRHADSAQSKDSRIEPDDRLDACFIVLDASGLASRFEEKGTTFAVPLREMPYGKEFYVSDPDGHVLAFVETGAA